VKAFIATHLARNETPRQIADAVKAYLGVEIDPDHVIPYWKGEIALPTQTEHRPDKESVQFPDDEPDESLFTRPASDETPDETPVTKSEAVMSAGDGTGQPTQTGHRQNAESLQIPADTVDEPNPAYQARRAAIEAQAALAKTKLGIAPEPETDPAAATQTGRRQD
jgi:hypothetical protein